MRKDIISIHDLATYQFNSIMDIARKLKEAPQRFKNKLKNKTFALVFQNPDFRTRVAFELGVVQLGGTTIYLEPEDSIMGIREIPLDIAKTLNQWVDGIILGNFNQEIVTDIAKNCSIPILNAWSDIHHPCQAITDFFTIKEKRLDLSSIKMAFIGDGNNVCHSLIFAAAKSGTHMAVATPPGYEPKAELTSLAEADGNGQGFKLDITNDPKEVMENSDIVYTNTWETLGKESADADWIKSFAPYQVNQKLMSLAKPEALFMHCLPAHRGNEVTDEVIESENSIIFDQSENKLHIQKAIMVLLLEEKKKNG